MSVSENRQTCPGWLADSVNAWLAAIGTTVLVPGLQLGWTDTALPEAVLEYSNDNPIAALIDAWPSVERLNTMPLANLGSRNVLVDDFAEQIIKAHGHPDAWTITSSMTDLFVAKKTNEVANGPFNPPVPKGIWLHHRLHSVHSTVTDPVEKIQASLKGEPHLVVSNGLGFNIARRRAGKPVVDPVVEVLAFFGLALFPVRGDGIKVKTLNSKGLGRQRGWQVSGRQEFVWPTWSQLERQEFVWPAWSQPLDRHGIDALLDAWFSRTWNYKRKEWPTSKRGRATWKRLGVHAAWQHTLYKEGRATYGYGSKRL